MPSRRNSAVPLISRLFKLYPKEITMKMTSILVLALMSGIMIPAIQQVHAASLTIDGIVSDSMCGKKHMMPGKTDAQCVQECVKSGSSYALVVGDKVYTLAGMPQSVAPFAGKHVHVEGSLKDNTITITSISDAMPKGMKM
jgi:hypothetical protein